MKPTPTVCDYCGEPSKWGYYRFDGGHVCDECGDFLLHAVKSHGSLQPMVSAGGLDECTQKIHGHPILPRKVNRPLKDLLVSITLEKHDIVIIDAASNQHDSVIIDPAKPRKFSVIFHKVGNCLFILVHGVISMFGVKISSTNVKERAPPQRGRTLRRGKAFILRVMLLTERLVAVAVSRLVRFFIDYLLWSE